MGFCQTAGCIVQSPGNCVFYTGPLTPYLRIATNTNLNQLISVLDTAIENIALSEGNVDYDLLSTLPFTQTNLNALYPTAPVGQKRVCPNLADGGIIYWKYSSTNWLAIPIGPVAP